MDIHIHIYNEKGERLRYINIYEDGSDAEMAAEITRDLLHNYDGAREFSP